MSAWYVFSAMGFYPVNPVSGEYVIGSYVFAILLA
jgi:putative alpha-1,2-mannosidase